MSLSLQQLARAPIPALRLSRPIRVPDPSPHAAEETVSTAMAMGATWGVVSCAFLQLFGPALLCKLNPNPEILHHATAFLR